MKFDEARKQFKDFWAEQVSDLPELATDAPARRQAWSIFIDQLQRNGDLTLAQAARIDIKD